MTYDPRAELAQAIHRKTDNGNMIVDFLKDVLDQNVADVRLTHRLQSARMLTKYGHFPDAERFLQRHDNKRAPKSPGANRKRRPNSTPLSGKSSSPRSIRRPPRSGSLTSCRDEHPP